MRRLLILIAIFAVSLPSEGWAAPRKSAALRAAERATAREARRADLAEARAAALAAQLADLQRPVPIVFVEPFLTPIEAPPAPPPPVEVPAPIKAMLDAVLRSQNDGEVATIVKYARNADPASGDLVLAAADKWRADRARARQTMLAEAGPFQLWSGRAEVGGYITTGNSETKGASAVLDIRREGLRWRHKLRLQGDYQESLDIVSREHLLVAYEPNLKIDANRYIYGAAQYETDRFLGYHTRYSVSAGYGYRAVRTPRVTLDLEIGPAFRATSFTDGVDEASLAGRGKLDFAWKLTPSLTLTQGAAAYIETYNSTIASNTAIDAKLLGPLSARLSYAVQYESMPPAGRRTTDTTSRAALVYSF